MSTCSSRHGSGCRQRGLTLVELIISIAVISIGVVGILQVMNLTSRRSADPLPRKQALAIAEAVLEEVQLMPFTLCDPDEYDMASGECGRLEGTELRPEPAMAGMKQVAKEAREDPGAPFDNVNDYNGYEFKAGAADLGNSAIVTIPPGYSATVIISNDGNFGPSGKQLPQAAVLRITVTVKYGGESLVLAGYRSRYLSDAMVLQ